MSIQRLHTGKRLSEAAIFNRTVYLAGQIAEDATQDMTGQAQQVLASIDRLLGEAGTDKSRILFAQIFIADMALFPIFNAVWDDWVSPGNAPARATVEAQLANPACLVEVVIVAAQQA